jgi:hypothetical protein
VDFLDASMTLSERYNVDIEIFARMIKSDKELLRRATAHAEKNKLIA